LGRAKFAIVRHQLQFSDKQLNLVQVFQVGHGNICVSRAEKAKLGHVHKRLFCLISTKVGSPIVILEHR
jgi:hypothetical protein